MKKTCIALAAVCAALFALPGVASAGVWHLEPEDGTTTNSFTASGGTSELITVSGEHKINSRIHCTSSSGEGGYETTTTGTIILLFHGCTTEIPFFGKVNCTTSGKTTGTIETTKLTFHNIQIHNNDPGVLITPNHTTNTFAHFSCAGVNVTVEGTGVIGDATVQCGATNVTTDVLHFDKGANNTQKYTQVTTTGTTYDLKRNNGETATQIGTGTITLTKASKVNCTA